MTTQQQQDGNAKRMRSSNRKGSSVYSDEWLNIFERCVEGNQFLKEIDMDKPDPTVKLEPKQAVKLMDKVIEDKLDELNDVSRKNHRVLKLPLDVPWLLTSALPAMKSLLCRFPRPSELAMMIREIKKRSKQDPQLFKGMNKIGNTYAVGLLNLDIKTRADVGRIIGKLGSNFTAITENTNGAMYIWMANPNKFKNWNEDTSHMIPPEGTTHTIMVYGLNTESVHDAYVHINALLADLDIDVPPQLNPPESRGFLFIKWDPKSDHPLDDVFTPPPFRGPPRRILKITNPETGETVLPKPPQAKNSQAHTDTYKGTGAGTATSTSTATGTQKRKKKAKPQTRAQAQAKALLYPRK